MRPTISLLALVTMVCLIKKGLSFNIDGGDSTRIQFSIDSSSSTPDTSSEFGWSIAFFKTLTDARLIVGAPKFNNSNGAVYACNVNGNDKTCTQMPSGNPSSTIDLDNPTAGERLGISVSTTDTSVVACAPLFRDFDNPTTFKVLSNLFPGRCATLNENLDFQYGESPCLNVTTQRNNPANYGSCGLGIGGVLSFKSESDNKVYRFFSAPGSGSNAGAVTVTADGLKISKFINKADVPFDTQDATYSNINNKVDGTPNGAFLGYATAKGNFTGDSLPGFAAGAPKSTNLDGEVTVYSYTLNPSRENALPINDDSSLSILTTIANPVQSKGGPSFFGSAMAAIDVNGDGFDDLVIGAPIFSTTFGNRIGQDEGKAFVFINNQRGKSFVYDDTVTLEGSNEEGARFGTTIVNIGDINDDGSDDLAIAAPWGGPDGLGMVFIYNTRNGTLVDKPSQILNSPASSSEFGFSMSSAKVDTRVYPDLAISAPKSGRVFLYKAKTIITLEDNVWVDRTSIPTDESNCNHNGVNYQCIKFRPRLKDVSKNAPAQFDVQVTIRSDVKNPIAAARRAFILDTDTNTLVETLTRNVSFTRGGEVPFEQTIFLSIDRNTNFGLPVTLTTAYSSVDTPTNCGNGPCVILDQFGTLSNSLDVEYLRLCGADNVCDIDLEIESAEINVIKSAPTSDDLLLVGSFNNEIKLTARVTNKNESAYLAKMRIDYDNDFQFLQASVNTRNIIADFDGKNTNGTGQILLFLLDNPVLENEKVNIEARFLLKEIDRPKFANYTFNLSVNSTGNDSIPANNEKQVDISMGIQSCITIALSQEGSKTSRTPGESTAPKVLYDHLKTPNTNPGILEDVGPNIQYTLLIQNLGQVPVENMSIDVTLVDRVGQQSVIFIDELLVDGRSCDQRIETNRLTGDNTGNEVNTTGNDVTTRRRRRRETVDITDNTRPPILNCLNGQCETYSCNNILNIPKEGVVRVRLSLAVYLTALQKFQSSQMEVEVRTKFNGQFKHIQQSGCEGSMKLVQPFERIQQEADGKKRVEWWIILVAVVGALILLAIFCAILYRIGFFKRQRPEDSQQLTGGHHIEKYQPRSKGYESD